MSEKNTKNVGRKSSYVLFERKMTRKMLSLVLIAIGAVFLLRELIRGRFGDAVVAFLTGVFRLDYSDALYIYEAIFRQNLDSIIAAAIILSLIVYWVIRMTQSRGEEETVAAAQAAPAAPVPAIDEDSYAVLLAAVSEEGRLSGEEFRVVSIREL